MPNVDIGEQGAVNNKGLAERLPGSINGLYAEDKMRSPELTVAVHENLRAEDKIEVSHVDCPDILSKH